MRLPHRWLAGRASTDARTNCAKLRRPVGGSRTVRHRRSTSTSCSARARGAHVVCGMRGSDRPSDRQKSRMVRARDCRLWVHRETQRRYSTRRRHAGLKIAGRDRLLGPRVSPCALLGRQLRVGQRREHIARLGGRDSLVRARLWLQLHLLPPGTRSLSAADVANGCYVDTGILRLAVGSQEHKMYALLVWCPRLSAALCGGTRGHDLIYSQRRTLASDRLRTKAGAHETPAAR